MSAECRVPSVQRYSLGTRHSALGTRHFCCSSIWRANGAQAWRKSMNILGWLLFGLIVGAIAKFLMPGRDPGGWIVTILLGIAGSFVGGFLASALLGRQEQTAGWIGSIMARSSSRSFTGSSWA